MSHYGSWKWSWCVDLEDMENWPMGVKRLHFFLPVKKLNVGENKLFPLFEGVHSLRKSWYDCLSFHLTLLAFYFYLILRIILFVLTQLCSSRVYLLHRFSEQIRRQNNLKNFASRIYSFPFQFTRGKKY